MKAAKLGEELEKALTFTDSQAYVGDALLDAAAAGHEKTIESVVNSVSPNKRALVGQSIYKAVAKKAEDWTAKNLDTVVSKDSFRPHEILGLDDSKWELVKSSCLLNRLRF